MQSVLFYFNCQTKNAKTDRQSTNTNVKLAAVVTTTVASVIYRKWGLAEEK